MIVENEEGLRDILRAEFNISNKEKEDKVIARSEEIAKVREKRGYVIGVISAVKLFLPSAFAIVVVFLFVATNFGVGYLVYTATTTELELIKAGKSFERLITPEVIKTLIISTAAQTATAFLIIIRFYFYKKVGIEKKGE